MSSWSRLVRFIPASPESVPGAALIGEPVNATQDVGLALYAGERVDVDVFSGQSVLAPGERTGKRAVVERILSPLAREEVGSIRCIGLNYASHARECKLAIPAYPILFMKPSEALSDPHPARTVIPRHTLPPAADEAGADFEAELVVVLGKEAKDVSEAEAMDYVLGYTAANDVSSRVAQFAQSQWSYSKSFDTACPLGPVLVAADAVPNPQDIKVRGELSGAVVQDGGIETQLTRSDLIFSIPKVISFLSQGTTLPAGTIILTGTPPGIGWAATPRRTLQDGDEFRVFVSHGVGTLINRIEHQK